MRNLLAAGLILFGLSGFGYAASTPEEAISDSLKQINSRINAISIKPAEMQGLYAIELDSGELLYSDAKGEFFMIGALYQLSEKEGFVNLTEGKRKSQRQEMLAQIEDKDIIVFPAEGERKATLTVFTDVSCGYCRKLHEEVPTLNKMGIQVNYLAFPRQGVGSRPYQVMESIWCAVPEKRNEMMTAAKTGGSVEPARCESPVLAQLMLGQSIGVTGTPALVFEDGTLLPGYLPAKQLAKRMNLE